MNSLPALAQSFKSFDELEAAYKEGVDYRIAISRGHHPQIAVIAPHGGAIERPTSQIATDIARDDFSCYLFEGIRKAKNYKALHLTSEYFDEPRCLELIAGCDRVVTVHGCDGDAIAVLLGGLDAELAALIADALAAEEVVAKLSGHQFFGTRPTNICNQGRSGAGAQMELTAALRKSPAAVASVVRAARGVLLRLAGSGNAPRTTGIGHLNR
jgi:phage replication-related protein YjqB (UPF0714/DUF867 family)